MYDFFPFLVSIVGKNNRVYTNEEGKKIPHIYVCTYWGYI